MNEGVHHIIGVLSISTYSEKICEEKEQDAKDILINAVLNPFIVRIRMELCYQYIRNFRSKYNYKNKQENKFDTAI